MKKAFVESYVAPEIDVIEVAVESGIATTGDGGIDDISNIPGPPKF